MPLAHYGGSHHSKIVRACAGTKSAPQDCRAAHQPEHRREIKGLDLSQAIFPEIGPWQAMGKRRFWPVGARFGHDRAGRCARLPGDCPPQKSRDYQAPLHPVTGVLNPWLLMRKLKPPLMPCGRFARAAGRFTMMSYVPMLVLPSRLRNLRKSQNFKVFKSGQSF
jgi:hypothetical protein